MPSTRHILPAVSALCLLAGLLPSCSKSGQVTNPAYPPGTVGAGELNGSLAASGGQYSHTFTTAGTYPYYCTIHPSCGGLTGTIVVLAPGSAVPNRVLAIRQSGGTPGPYGGASCAALSLQEDTVFVGDRVTWTNNSPIRHTVTSQ